MNTARRVVASTLVLVALGPLAGCSSSGGGSAVAIPSPGSTVPATPATDVVAVRDDGSIAVVDVATGAVRRELLAASAPGVETSAVRWSPDRRTVYYDRDNSVWSLSADGGKPVRITWGRAASPSPDGTRLALTRESSDNGNDTIVVFDLSSRTEKRWRLPVTTHVDQVRVVGYPTWSPDGRTLAYFVAGEDPGQTYLLDTANGGRLGGKAERLAGPDSPGRTNPRWVGPGRLAVWEWVSDKGATPAETRWHKTRLVVVDVGTGAVVGELATPTGEVWGTDLDATGRVLWWNGSGLYRFDAKTPVRIAAGSFVAADW